MKTFGRVLVIAMASLPVIACAQKADSSGTQSVLTASTRPPGNIRVADQFPGLDWCSKVTAADAELGSAAGEIWMSQAAGVAACASAPRVGNYHTLRFVQAGVYPISVGWTIAREHDLGIIGTPGTVISFNGQSGFVVDGSQLGNGARRILIRDMIFSGNSSISNAITFDKVVESTFDNLGALNANSAAILCKGCLSDTFIRPSSSTNNNLGPISYKTVPTAGLQLDSDGKVSSNSNQIIAPVMEGLTRGAGISIVSGASNVITSGTSEANEIGISISSRAADNEIIGIDLESNSKADIDDSGARNSFSQVRAFSGPSALIRLNSGANDTKFIGGAFQTITIAMGVTGTSLIGVVYSASGKGGVINDGGSYTLKLNVRNLYTGSYENNVAQPK